MKMSVEAFSLQTGTLPNPSGRKLLQKAAQLATLAAVCSCAREGPIRVNVSKQPTWVVEAFEKTQEFWGLQDVAVELTDGAFDIAIEVVSEERINGQFAHWSESIRKIRVSERVETRPRIAFCALSHEIGHAIGMDHVEGSRHLMSAIMSVPEDGCWWSPEDQIELCRVTGCGAEASEEGVR